MLASEHHQGIIGWIACGVLGLCILLVEECANTSPVNASADLSKERVLHPVATHLRINLQEARSGFGLFGRHSYIYDYFGYKDAKYQRYTK